MSMFQNNLLTFGMILLQFLPDSKPTQSQKEVVVKKEAGIGDFHATCIFCSGNTKLTCMRARLRC